MAAQYTSKHGLVPRSQSELYMSFVDMRNFSRMLPDDKRDMVSATYDDVTFTVQGFSIGVKVCGRVPYSLIQLQDAPGAPFHFGISLHFDSVEDTGKTDFWIQLDADLNLMMKAMLGSRIQEGLDKIVDTLSNV